MLEVNATEDTPLATSEVKNFEMAATAELSMNGGRWETELLCDARFC